MSLLVEYGRPYQIDEPENLQNIILKDHFYTIRSMYPEKLIRTIILKHFEKFVCFVGESEYELVFRNDKINERNFTIYLPPQVKNHRKIKELEKDGYKFYKIDVLTITTYNSIKNLHPIFYKKYIPKSMLANKLLYHIDRNFDNFKHMACEYDCLDRNCKNTNPITRYVCYKLYNTLI